VQSAPAIKVLNGASGSSRGGVIGTGRVVVESNTIANAVVAGIPRLAEGVELIGEYQGSGLQEPGYIVRRADGQIIQLPWLLYLLASSLDGERDLQQVAALVSVESVGACRRSRCHI
jgi:hypothetical protein